MRTVNGDLLVTRRATAGLAQGFPVWASVQDYKVGDYVEEQGVLYRCKDDHTSTGSFTFDQPTKWDPLQAESSGGSGTKVDFTDSSALWTGHARGFSLTVTQAEHSIAAVGAVTVKEASTNQEVIAEVNVSGDSVELVVPSKFSGSMIIMSEPTNVVTV